jgi:hypothetical protein
MLSVIHCFRKLCIRYQRLLYQVESLCGISGQDQRRTWRASDCEFCSKTHFAVKRACRSASAICESPTALAVSQDLRYPGNKNAGRAPTLVAQSEPSRSDVVFSPEQLCGISALRAEVHAAVVQTHQVCVHAVPSLVNVSVASSIYKERSKERGANSQWARFEALVNLRLTAR